MATALYLAHLNPVTDSHVSIIRRLQDEGNPVVVMPVIFLRDDTEINTRSSPFSFDARSRMITSVFGESVKISRNYVFYAPFSRYLPPLLSPRSWELKKRILGDIRGDFFTYTGDRTEGYMLRAYGLHPRVGRRMPVSATSVREKLYGAARGDRTEWKRGIPDPVCDIIEAEWDTVLRFRDAHDDTRRVLGMKFPKDGWSG